MTNVALRAPHFDFTRQKRSVRRVHSIVAVSVIEQQEPLLKEATGVHPVVVWIAIGAFAWFVAAAWIAFAGAKDAAVAIFVVAFINVMLIGLLARGGWYSRNMTPERKASRSFRSFLNGSVDIATGGITGYEAMVQIAAMPIIMSIGGTIIIALAVYSGAGG